jgi:hypothetical protein
MDPDTNHNNMMSNIEDEMDDNGKSCHLSASPAPAASTFNSNQQRVVPALLIKAVSTTQWSPDMTTYAAAQEAEKGQAIGSESGVTVATIAQKNLYVVMPPCIVFIRIGRI